MEEKGNGRTGEGDGGERKWVIEERGNGRIGRGDGGEEMGGQGGVMAQSSKLYPISIPLVPATC